MFEKNLEIGYLLDFSIFGGRKKLRTDRGVYDVKEDVPDAASVF